MSSCFTILVWWVLAAAGVAGAGTIPLAGEWRFRLDPDDRGLAEGWAGQALPGTIRLPGTLAGQGVGDEVGLDTPWVGGIADRSFFTAPEYAAYRAPGQVKIPFWLQPDKYYAGAAWYQRDIEVPMEWASRRVVLFLERAHWETRLWVDGACVGTNRSLSTPHEYDLGRLGAGRHSLTVRVDNRRIVDIGENSHGISDHTQGNWNGLAGRLELRSTPLVWLDQVQVYPDLERWRCRAVAIIGNRSGRSGEGVLRVRDAGGAVLAMSPLGWTADGGTGRVEFAVPPGGGDLWDEFTPTLHPVRFEISTGDARDVRLGLREIATRGTQFTINGRPVFLRGTLECAIFPRTGHPPMEVGEWRRIIRTAKSFGLNHLRFHSWCPAEAAFLAADELGMYLQVETCWPNQSTTLGDGKPVDSWARQETERILAAYGNHPSFVLMALGNEPGGGQASGFLADYLRECRARDPRRLWTGASGWPELPENQYHVSPGPRIQQWGAGLSSRINAQPPETASDYRAYVRRRGVPVISHEIGQWCVYPNFGELPKYTGYLKPRNFEVFRDRLEGQGLGGLAHPFLLASGKLQTLCYKEEIESALRTPGLGGFQLLDLHDFPGQGTALVGVLDPFWEEKGYVSAAQYRRFCNATVPLARLSRRVYTTRERIEVPVEIAHFGPAPLTGTVVKWKLVTEENIQLAGGNFPAQTIPVDNAVAVGRAVADLRGVDAPARCRLVVALAGTAIANDWDLWVYPEHPEPEATPEVLVTAEFDEAARERLAAGGSVLLTIPGAQVRNDETAPVQLGFSSIFWNTAWTDRQAPTTLGILCDPDHPALAGFPTDAHTNWQWWYLLHRAGALRLNGLPRAVDPIVRVIDDWVTARPLGLIVEGQVGSGRIVICGFDLTRNAEDPVSRQLRASLLRYLASPASPPPVALQPRQIEALIIARPGGSHGLSPR